MVAQKLTRITPTVLVNSLHLPANLVVEISVAYVHSSGRILGAHAAGLMYCMSPGAQILGELEPLGLMNSAPMVLQRALSR